MNETNLETIRRPKHVQQRVRMQRTRRNRAFDVRNKNKKKKRRPTVRFEY